MASWFRVRNSPCANAGVNDRFIQNAFNIELGALYDFRMILQARASRAAIMSTRWSICPARAGWWGRPSGFTVVPGDAPPSYTVQIPATGETIDLEHYGFGRVVGWHIVFGILGLAWLGLLGQAPDARPLRPAGSRG